jgi:small subunit ribosomal protein S24e
MDIKVLEEKKNPLLQRREVKFSVSHNLGTPSRDEIKAKIAAYLNSKPELVIIKRMNSEFGKRETKLKMKRRTVSAICPRPSLALSCLHSPGCTQT